MVEVDRRAGALVRAGLSGLRAGAPVPSTVRRQPLLFAVGIKGSSASCATTVSAGSAGIGNQRRSSGVKDVWMKAEIRGQRRVDGRRGRAVSGHRVARDRRASDCTEPHRRTRPAGRIAAAIAAASASSQAPSRHGDGDRRVRHPFRKRVSARCIGIARSPDRRPARRHRP